MSAAVESSSGTPPDYKSFKAPGTTESGGEVSNIGSEERPGDDLVFTRDGAAPSNVSAAESPAVGKGRSDKGNGKNGEGRYSGSLKHLLSEAKGGDALLILKKDLPEKTKSPGGDRSKGRQPNDHLSEDEFSKDVEQELEASRHTAERLVHDLSVNIENLKAPDNAAKLDEQIARYEKILAGKMPVIESAYIKTLQEIQNTVKTDETKELINRYVKGLKEIARETLANLNRIKAKAGEAVNLQKETEPNNTTGVAVPGNEKRQGISPRRKGISLSAGASAEKQASTPIVTEVNGGEKNLSQLRAVFGLNEDAGVKELEKRMTELRQEILGEKNNKKILTPEEKNKWDKIVGDYKRLKELLKEKGNSQPEAKPHETAGVPSKTERDKKSFQEESSRLVKKFEDVADELIDKYKNSDLTDHTIKAQLEKDIQELESLAKNRRSDAYQEVISMFNSGLDEKRMKQAFAFKHRVVAKANKTAEELRNKLSTVDSGGGVAEGSVPISPVEAVSPVTEGEKALSDAEKQELLLNTNLVLEEWKTEAEGDIDFYKRDWYPGTPHSNEDKNGKLKKEAVVLLMRDLEKYRDRISTNLEQANDNNNTEYHAYKRLKDAGLKQEAENFKKQYLEITSKTLKELKEIAKAQEAGVSSDKPTEGADAGRSEENPSRPGGGGDGGEATESPVGEPAKGAPAGEAEAGTTTETIAELPQDLKARYREILDSKAKSIQSELDRILKKPFKAENLSDRCSELSKFYNKQYYAGEQGYQEWVRAYSNETNINRSLEDVDFYMDLVKKGHEDQAREFENEYKRICIEAAKKADYEWNKAQGSLPDSEYNPDELLEVSKYNGSGQLPESPTSGELSWEQAEKEYQELIQEKTEIIRLISTADNLVDFEPSGALNKRKVEFEVKCKKLLAAGVPAESLNEKEEMNPMIVDMTPEVNKAWEDKKKALEGVVSGGSKGESPSGEGVGIGTELSPKGRNLYKGLSSKMRKVFISIMHGIPLVGKNARDARTADKAVREMAEQPKKRIEQGEKEYLRAAKDTDEVVSKIRDINSQIGELRAKRTALTQKADQQSELLLSLRILRIQGSRGEMDPGQQGKIEKSIQEIRVNADKLQQQEDKLAAEIEALDARHQKYQEEIEQAKVSLTERLNQWKENNNRKIDEISDEIDADQTKLNNVLESIKEQDSLLAQLVRGIPASSSGNPELARALKEGRSDLQKVIAKLRAEEQDYRVRINMRKGDIAVLEADNRQKETQIRRMGPPAVGGGAETGSAGAGGRESLPMTTEEAKRKMLEILMGMGLGDIIKRKVAEAEWDESLEGEGGNGDGSSLEPVRKKTGSDSRPASEKNKENELFSARDIIDKFNQFVGENISDPGERQGFLISEGDKIAGLIAEAKFSKESEAVNALKGILKEKLSEKLPSKSLSLPEVADDETVESYFEKLKLSDFNNENNLKD